MVAQSAKNRPIWSHCCLRICYAIFGQIACNSHFPHIRPSPHIGNLYIMRYFDLEMLLSYIILKKYCFVIFTFNLNFVKSIIFVARLGLIEMKNDITKMVQLKNLHFEIRLLMFLLKCY